MLVFFKIFSVPHSSICCYFRFFSAPHKICINKCVQRSPWSVCNIQLWRGRGGLSWRNHSGENISRTLGARVGSIGYMGPTKVVGVVSVHPYFGGTDDDKIWLIVSLMNLFPNFFPHPFCFEISKFMQERQVDNPLSLAWCSI